ncbi:MAG: hypothetical protein ACM3U2_01715 [Deltaproteobacteria bacterium]
MSNPATQPSPEPADRVGHETRDASPFYVGLFALGLVVMIALVLPLLGWMLQRFEAEARQTDAVQSPLAGDQHPPEPRLQSQPQADLARLRLEEEQRLSSYAWIDPHERVVRIPIGRAIEILAERGFPEPEGPIEALQKEDTTP